MTESSIAAVVVTASRSPRGDHRTPDTPPSGAQNAVRNPRRMSGTAASLMVGVAVVTVFTVMGASIKASVNESVNRSFGGDLVVKPSGFGDAGISPALTRTW